jgi:hypothetical protein
MLAVASWMEDMDGPDPALLERDTLRRQERSVVTGRADSQRHEKRMAGASSLASGVDVGLLLLLSLLLLPFLLTLLLTLLLLLLLLLLLGSGESGESVAQPIAISVGILKAKEVRLTFVRYEL